MSVGHRAVRKHRNRNFEETHSLLIETAKELISASGADGVSLSMLARVTGINRSTVYYHFSTRQELMCAAQEFLPKKIENDFGLFQRNAAGGMIWVDNADLTGTIRERYPQWKHVVRQIEDVLTELAADETCGAEVYCALMLTSASIASRSFENSTYPFDLLRQIVNGFHSDAALDPEPSSLN